MKILIALYALNAQLFLIRCAAGAIRNNTLHITYVVIYARMLIGGGEKNDFLRVLRY